MSQRFGDYKMFIGGRWSNGSGKRLEVFSPATEAVVGTVPLGTPDDAEQAMDAARTAQPDWARLPAIQRGQLVKKPAEAVLADREHLARVVVTEQGKPLNQALGEIDAMAMFLEYAGEQARRI